MAKGAITEISYSHEEGLSGIGLQKFILMLSVCALLALHLLFSITFLQRPFVFYSISYCRGPVVVHLWSVYLFIYFILNICDNSQQWLSARAATVVAFSSAIFVEKIKAEIFVI